jgi:hypothetical protein
MHVMYVYAHCLCLYAVCTQIGSYNLKYASEHVRDFEKFFPAKWFTTPVNAKATIHALKELHKLTQKWAEARSKRAESATPRLLTFSEWLADFDSTQYSLEVPGQYGGSSRGPPREDLHSKIIR